MPDFLYIFAEHAVAANDLARAVALVEPAIAQFKKTSSAGGEFSSRLLLADAILRTGRAGDAESELVKAEALAKKTTLRPRQTVNARRIRLALVERGKDPAAVKNQLGSLRTALQLIGDPVRVEATTRVAVMEGQLALGEGLLGVGDVEAAARVANASLALARLAVLPGQASDWVGEATLLQARVERATGHPEQARALASEAEKEFSDTLSPTHPLRLEARALALEAGQASKSTVQ